jgi:hypothetical protein
LIDCWPSHEGEGVGLVADEAVQEADHRRREVLGLVDHDCRIRRSFGRRDSRSVEDDVGEVPDVQVT